MVLRNMNRGAVTETRPGRTVIRIFLARGLRVSSYGIEVFLTGRTGTDRASHKAATIAHLDDRDFRTTPPFGRRNRAQRAGVTTGDQGEAPTASERWAMNRFSCKIGWPLCAIAAMAVTGALLLVGCSSLPLPSAPDLDLLYSRLAQGHGPEHNPVIVIPGLTGSKLIHGATGRVVWGVFSGDYARPQRPEDARLIALPMREGAPLRELLDDVQPAGVLERIRFKVLGVPINLQAYFHILEALGAGGYRDENLAASGEVDWGDQHFTCFQFDYDWRRDNVENAQRLDRFIVEKKAYVRSEIMRRYGIDRPNLKFDVVSHSMGGLLLRYYLRYGSADLPEDGSLPEVTWAGAANVEKAVLIAPPNAGTLESLLQLVEGKGYGPFAGYPAALLGTLPSGYQMLPRGRHGLVFLGDEPIEDLFDPDLWLRMRWGLASAEAEEMISWLLPDEGDPAVRRRIAIDHQRKVLERAGRFSAALDQPAEKPAGLELYLVAGDSVRTAQRMVVVPPDLEAGSGTAMLSIVETGPGDGKVLRSSALMDERLGSSWSPYLRSPIDWRTVMFLPHRHLNLTKQPVFTDNLLFWLLEQPRSSNR